MLISFTVELFGKGVMFAHFQINGNCSFLKDSLINIETGRAKISAKSFRTKLGMLSGPALCVNLLILLFGYHFCGHRWNLITESVNFASREKLKIVFLKF